MKHVSITVEYELYEANTNTQIRISLLSMQIGIQLAPTSYV